MVQAKRPEREAANQSPVPVGMRQVLSQISAELERQADQLAIVEAVIGQLTDQAGPVDQRMVLELQHIDAVRQSAAALSAFSAGLARLVPGEWMVEVMEAVNLVKLSAMASRLQHAGVMARSDPIESNGDLEMFD